VGVSPRIGSYAVRLASDFATRWDGERPMIASHFYYDATLLWALAAEGAARAGWRPPAAR